ncbi:MAG TPA: hypothetical protein DCY73_02275 [Lachnospiraceae bacterium]|nr:hypothetical protein [Lachnospiraceae bacterium]
MKKKFSLESPNDFIVLNNLSLVYSFFFTLTCAIFILSCKYQPIMLLYILVQTPLFDLHEGLFNYA